MNASTRATFSFDAFLEIGPQPKVLSHDKLEDLFEEDANTSFAFGSSERFAGFNSIGAVGFISVSAGTIGSQILDNTGATTQQSEPNHCGVLGGASKWFGLQPVDDGVLLIDTIGSAIDTVLAVYTGTNILTLTAVACDRNSAPDGIRSLVRFNPVKGSRYSVAVDGVNGAQGNINLNWRLGTRWGRMAQTLRTVRQGGDLTLSITLTNVFPDPTFQWRWNGRDIAGATHSVLALSNLQASQAGIYSLIVSNFAGAVTNTISTVTVALPIQVAYQMTRTNGLIQFGLTAPSSQGLVVEASTDLMNWIHRYTNSAASVPLNFWDTSVPNSPLRFYRVMPWP